MTVPAIATAAYTAYKVAIATKKYTFARIQSNMSVITLKRISLKEAMASVLTLQYILVMTFGNGVDSDMLPMCASSTFYPGVASHSVAYGSRQSSSA